MVWSASEVNALSRRYEIRPGCRLHDGAEDYHFPEKRFLAGGYTPPGGYVKDFGVVLVDDRLHLLHIDGRPGEVCWITGNEISFGHASTSDFQRWIRHPMPLAVGDRSWEREHVWAPYVYRRHGVYYLFYMGSGGGETFVSYATSIDLERWDRWPDGPIRHAVGRDPFVFDHDGAAVLLYTGHGGARIGGCISTDMVSWQPIPDVIEIPGGIAAESCSLHSRDSRYVLWFNDYGEGLAGFRAAYAVSEDPFQFSPESIQEFTFHCDTPGVEPSRELPVTKPVPLSIELVAAGERIWFVSYFRWQTDRNRLYFGALDWTAEPAAITEINNEEHLQHVLQAVGLRP